MKLFESWGKKPAVEAGSKKEKIDEGAIIHEDFEYLGDGFHGNAAYKELGSKTESMTPRKFTFSEYDIIRGMLEKGECDFPVKIKRLGNNEYEGLAYYTKETVNSIDEWIYHNIKKFKGAEAA